MFALCKLSLTQFSLATRMGQEVHVLDFFASNEKKPKTSLMSDETKLTN